MIEHDIFRSKRHIHKEGVSEKYHRHAHLPSKNAFFRNTG